MFILFLMVPCFYQVGPDIIEGLVFGDISIAKNMWFWYGVFWPYTVIGSLSFWMITLHKTPEAYLRAQADATLPYTFHSFDFRDQLSKMEF